MKDIQARSDNIDDFIYGIHPVIEAIEAGREIERLFIQRDLSNPALSKLKALANKINIKFDIVPGGKLNRITRKNHQGVICYLSLVNYFNIDEAIQDEYNKGKDPLILVLDRITDVRNFGSICRTAECMGVSAILIPEKGSAMVNSEAAKASAGAISKIKICRSHNLKLSLKSMKETGLKVVACTEKGEHSISESVLTGPLVIIMGSEQNGVSGEYLKLSDDQIKIPMSGKISSLNVSVATGMLLYEVARQNSKK